MTPGMDSPPERLEASVERRRSLEDFDLARPRIIRQLQQRIEADRQLARLYYRASLMAYGLGPLNFLGFLWASDFDLRLHLYLPVLILTLGLPCALGVGLATLSRNRERHRQELEGEVAQLTAEHRTLTGTEPEEWLSHKQPE